MTVLFKIQNLFALVTKGLQAFIPIVFLLVSCEDKDSVKNKSLEQEEAKHRKWEAQEDSAVTAHAEFFAKKYSAFQGWVYYAPKSYTYEIQNEIDSAKGIVVIIGDIEDIIRDDTNYVVQFKNVSGMLGNYETNLVAPLSIVDSLTKSNYKYSGCFCFKTNKPIQRNTISGSLFDFYFFPRLKD